MSIPEGEFPLALDLNGHCQRFGTRSPKTLHVVSMKRSFFSVIIPDVVIFGVTCRIRPVVPFT